MWCGGVIVSEQPPKITHHFCTLSMVDGSLIAYSSKCHSDLILSLLTIIRSLSLRQVRCRKILTLKTHFFNPLAMSKTKSDDIKDDNLNRQGSFRKLVPGNSNGDSPFSMSVKMIDRPIVSQTNKQHAVFLQEYNILSEYKMLYSQDLKGIYVIPSALNSFCLAHPDYNLYNGPDVNISIILLWFGVHFVRQGIYKGGVFRFTITLPSNFPLGDCPKVVFETQVFHPLINLESGELCTSWGFPEWRRNNRIWQLIQYITKIFIKLDTKMTAVNQKASDLQNNNFEVFQECVKTCVKESVNQVFNSSAMDDPHYITFSSYVNELHDPIKQEIYESTKSEEENKPLGLSWVQPGSLQSFSKPEAR